MNLRIPEQNKVLLVGRLTRDPELRYTQKGQPVCRFDLAANRRYKKANGEWQDETAFVPIIVLWKDMAERCGERLKKGSPVSVEGRLRTRKWETKNGEPRSTLEVIAQRVQFLSKEDVLPEETETFEPEVHQPLAETKAEITSGSKEEETSPTSSVRDKEAPEEDLPF